MGVFISSVESKHCIPWLTASALSMFHSISTPITLTVSWTAPSAGSSSTKGHRQAVLTGILTVYTDESMGLYLVHELLKGIWPTSYQKPRGFFLVCFSNFFRLHVFPMNISCWYASTTFYLMEIYYSELQELK